jgi:hypothetical protein
MLTSLATNIVLITVAGFMYFSIIELLDWYAYQHSELGTTQDNTPDDTVSCVSSYSVDLVGFIGEVTNIEPPKVFTSQSWVDEPINNDLVKAYNNLVHSEFTYFDNHQDFKVPDKSVTNYTSETITTPNLDSYSYRELQKLAKSRGLKANIKREELILSLA